MDKNTMNKLKKWIDEHSEEADTPQINLTTQKEFTVREILEQEMDAQKRGVAIVDEDTLEIEKQIEDWIKRI